MKRLGAICPIAVAILMTLTAGTALANHVQCGDVVTQSIKLDSDVVCADAGPDTPITGIVVAADNIVIDLNGHTIRASGYSENDDVNGIVGDGVPHSGVRIRDGSIVGFSQAINFGFPRRSPLNDSVIRNIAGSGSIAVYLRGDGNRVDNSRLSAGYDALRLRGDRNVVRRNIMRSVEGPGLDMSGARPAAIDNTVSVPDYGYQSAIQIFDFTDALVRGNTAFDVRIAPGILLERGHGGRVTGNVATRTRVGIRVADSTGLLVDKNDASGNLGNPEGGYPGEGTGIFVDSGNVVRKNTANDNDGFGIYAEPGVIDGGGNRASGNGVADCVNVICK